ncbi:MAG: transcription termination/antitermination NusG family protein [Deltaproteobacteria bacterium]|nr:transcription termination/antitermination NusG family protein [Deltaproteobacteria bacterium]
MSDQGEWYVVRSKPRREEYAQDQLLRRGVETFLPRILEPARGRLAPVVGPLFPGYLFARVDLLSQYNRVIWAPGVSRFVAFGDVPASVDPEVIAFLRERAGAAGIVRVVRTFHDGDVVRVTRGPLHGLEGVVDGHASGQARVRVLMELLRRRTQVSVPSQLLEHVAHA